MVPSQLNSRKRGLLIQGWHDPEIFLYPISPFDWDENDEKKP